MRDLTLVDAVITLHDVARLVEEHVGRGNLSDDIRNCADRLHLLSIDQGHASNVTDEIIRHVKK